jgi:hypothetical protein
MRISLCSAVVAATAILFCQIDVAPAGDLWDITTSSTTGDSAAAPAAPSRLIEFEPPDAPLPPTAAAPGHFLSEACAQSSSDFWGAPDATPSTGPEWSPNSANLFDGLSGFAGLDGSKQPQDLGVNANMGGRIAFNWGIPIVQEWGLGVQVGVAYNFADSAVQVLHRLNISDRRDQLYNTLGIFQRTDWGLNWSVAHDFLWESYYDNFQLGQWRARVGYQLTAADEVGVWSTIADFGDSGSVMGVPIHLRPINQVNAFWRHVWPSCAWTTLWVGGAQEHGRFVLVLPDTRDVRNSLVYGADLQIPLNDYLAIYGEANFMTPVSSGVVDAYLGFVFYPGGGARNALQKRFAPLLQTASNTSFAVDLPR